MSENQSDAFGALSTNQLPLQAASWLRAALGLAPDQDHSPGSSNSSVDS